MAKHTPLHKKLAFRLTLFAIATLILGLSLIWQTQINYALKLTQIHEGAYEGTNAQVIRADGGDLVVHFIDVGQGDACVVELPDGRTMLIDAGPGSHKAQLIAYLNENFSFNRFDFAILTHSDEDHSGGMKDVLSQYTVDLFYRPNEKCDKPPYIDPAENQIVGSGKKSTTAYFNAIDAIYKSSREVVVTYMPTLTTLGYDRITPEGKNEGDAGFYEVQFFAPYGHSYKNLNDYSPIIILEYENHRIALSGDAEKQAETEFVQHATEKAIPSFARFTDSYSVNVLKLGHHGSKTSSQEAYLNTLTTPASTKDVLVVISCGMGNKYNHPHTDVLTRLKSLGFLEENILRTDQNSTIVLAIRYDDSLNGGGGYGLFYGATAHNIEQHAPVNWMQIAIGIWLFILLVLIAPLIFRPKLLPRRKKRRRRRAR